MQPLAQLFPSCVKSCRVCVHLRCAAREACIKLIRLGIRTRRCCQGGLAVFLFRQRNLHAAAICCAGDGNWLRSFMWQHRPHAHDHLHSKTHLMSLDTIQDIWPMLWPPTSSFFGAGCRVVVCSPAHDSALLLPQHGPLSFLCEGL